jgi:hypothetical protein
MNALAPPSLSLRPVADFAQRAANELDRLARREPNLALAATAGALLVLKVVPLRWIVASVTMVARPALLALGVCKAYEMLQNASMPADESAPKRPRH